MRALLAALMLLGATAGPDETRVTVIVGATLVDGGGRAAVPDSVVIIRGTTIAGVGDRIHTPIPKGAVLVDGRRSWIAPATPDGVPTARAIAAIVAGPIARLAVGQPAHLALLDADPRREPATTRVRRLWISGQGREIADPGR